MQQSGPIKSLDPDAGYRRLDLALVGLVILRTNAVAVIPDLARVASDPAAPGSVDAIRALIEIGEPAVPALTNLLSSAQSSYVKEGIRMGLGKIGSAASIQALILDLQNPNMMAAGQSAAMPGKIGQQPEIVVPALTAALDDPRWFMRQCAAGALGKFGPAALPAVPKLKSLLGTDVYLVDDAARQTLRKIAPDALIGAPEWKRPVNIAPGLITPLPSRNP
jgi:HEAT repeat protein